MKRLLHVLATAYICFAIITAYTAVPSNLPCGERDLGSRAHAEQTEATLCSDSSLDRFDARRQRGYEEYTITIWTSPTCAPCKKYLREEVPALLKAGFIVYIFDGETAPEYVKAFPTVTLSHAGELLTVENYWKAKDIKKFVDTRAELKNE